MQGFQTAGDTFIDSYMQAEGFIVSHDIFCNNAVLAGKQFGGCDNAILVSQFHNADRNSWSRFRAFFIEEFDLIGAVCLGECSIADRFFPIAGYFQFPVIIDKAVGWV